MNPNQAVQAAVQAASHGAGPPAGPEQPHFQQPVVQPGVQGAGDLDTLLEGLFDHLGRLGADAAGIETLEVIGEDAGAPAIVVYRSPGGESAGQSVGEIVVVTGDGGPRVVEQTVRMARGGYYPTVRPTAPVIVVQANPPADFVDLVTSLDASHPSVALLRNPPEAAYRVMTLLDRSTQPAASQASEHGSPHGSPDRTRHGAPSASPASPAGPSASSFSAVRDFDLAAGSRGRGAGDDILSPEQREAILEAREAAAAAQSKRKSFFRRWPFSRSVEDEAEPYIEVGPTEPVVFPPLRSEVIRRLYHSPFPSVFPFVNNKGGVGKTSVAIGTAAAFCQMGRNPAGAESLRVLVVEQNFLNPDIESRMQLQPGSIRGLGSYLEDLLTAWESGRFSPNGQPFDLKPYTSHSFVENLDVLLIGTAEDERRIAEDYLPEAAFEAVFRELYRSLGDSYDIVCVDLANSRPEADRGDSGKTSSARLIGFWASAADGIFVPFDASKTSYQQARRVVSEAQTLCVEEEAPGVPPMAGVVPILNFFPEQRRGDLTWMADDEEEAWRLEHEYLPAVGADHARLPGVAPGAATLKIPNYKEINYYNNAGRIPCLESPRFARAYIPIVMDASARAYENQGIRAQAIS